MVAGSKWKYERLGDVGGVRSGRQRSPHYSEGEPRLYLRVANVFDGYIDTTDVFRMPFSDEEFRVYRLQAGDILLNEGQSLELVGRAALYAGEPADCCFQNSLIRFRPGSRVNEEYVLEILRHYQRTGRFAAIATKTTSIAHLGVERLSNVRIPVPPLPVQVSTAAGMRTWNRTIEIVARLIAAKRMLSAALVQRFMVAAVSAGKPFLLGDLARESKRTNADGALSVVMGVSKFDGIVPMKAQSVGTNLKRYKVLCPGSFAYNPMRINIGSIARWKGDQLVLVSPDYVVFESDCSKLEPRFLDFYRRSRAWQHFVESAGKGSVRVRIYFDDLAGMRLRVPPLKLQGQIADVLESLDSEISLLENLRELLLVQKSAVLRAVVGD